ncbi:MAG: hypothetical protein K2I40_04165 [Bifidobacterium castoris]|nr:hypothetical protein [Bifidobacterium castoris]
MPTDLRLSNTVELLDRTRGLSLSDQYWVRDADEDVCWEDINFFNNTFPEQLGYALLSERSSSHRFSFDAPDASTGGDLPKRWTVGADGTRLLISNADYKTRPFFVTTTSPTARRQLHLIRHWDRYDLDARDDWPEDVARHLGQYGLMSEARIRLIRQALQERVQQAKQARDR